MASNTPDHNATNPEVLNSWKEIACYLGRGVRTVQRWEIELGLPVHRPRGKSRSAVLAFKPDLDRWLHQTHGGTVAPPAPAVSLAAQNPIRAHVSDGKLFDRTAFLIGQTHALLLRSTSIFERSKHLYEKVNLAISLTSTLMENKSKWTNERDAKQNGAAG